MDILNIDSETVYAVGDIHGCFNSLVGMIKDYNITDSVIICCGDCGLGFSTPEGTKNELFKLNKICREKHNKVFMVRGNHDNPEYFEKGLINTKYIIAVPDYSVIRQPFKPYGNILCVGGAASIDRLNRLANKEINVRHYMKYHPGCTIEEAKDRTSDGYWENEAPVYNEDALNIIKNEGIGINHVITHTCPSFCDPIHKNGLEYWINSDPGLVEVIDNERNVMDKLYNKLISDGHHLESWTYGHYHRHSSQTYNNIKFTMLDAITMNNTRIDWIEIKMI